MTTIVYRVRVVVAPPAVPFVLEDHTARTARGMEGWAAACRLVHPGAKVQRSVTYVPEVVR